MPRQSVEAAGTAGGNVGVADVDDGLVVDQVQLLDGGRVDLAVQDFLEPGVQFSSSRQMARSRITVWWR